jgi:hypothetical protein
MALRPEIQRLVEAVRASVDDRWIRMPDSVLSPIDREMRNALESFDASEAERETWPAVPVTVVTSGNGVNFVSLGHTTHRGTDTHWTQTYVRTRPIPPLVVPVGHE